MDDDAADHLNIDLIYFVFPQAHPGRPFLALVLQRGMHILARGVSKVGNRQYCHTRWLDHVYLSNPKPGHTTGGYERGGARRGGGAGRGEAGQDAGGPVRQGNNCPLCSPEHRRQTVLDDSSEARISEMLCKPDWGFMTRGLPMGRRPFFVLAAD